MTTTHDSTTHDSTTFLAGGTGKTGRRVAERLRNLGRDVRIGSRRGAIRFDWEDPTTYGPALAGAAAAYVPYAPDIAIPGALEQLERFVGAAEGAGVRRLVLLSGRGEPAAQAAEEMALASTIDTAIVRCSFFAQNFSEHFLVDAVHHGTIALPAGEVAEPVIDADDIADVAVRALTEAGHGGRIHELTGPELLTFEQMAAQLGHATGTAVEYVAVSADEWAAGAVADGVPAAEAYGLAEVFALIFDGHNASVTTGVADALGRPATTFAEYCTRAAAAGAWRRPVA